MVVTDILVPLFTVIGGIIYLSLGVNTAYTVLEILKLEYNFSEISSFVHWLIKFGLVITIFIWPVVLVSCFIYLLIKVIMVNLCGFARDLNKTLTKLFNW